MSNGKPGLSSGSGLDHHPFVSPDPGAMMAVVPVRDGILPAGGAEAVAEAGGTAIVVGDGTERAAAVLTGPGRLRLAEWGAYAPGRWSASLAPWVAEATVVVLPASADGRDLAPRLARCLRRPLLAGAVLASPGRVVVARHQGRVAEAHTLRGPVVATLLPGVRGVEPSAERPEVARLDVAAPPAVGSGAAPGAADVVVPPPDGEVLEVLPPDPATVDLSEAVRVLAGGAGLGHADRFDLLARVAAGLGATPGATRVVADAGWVPAHRYIGTTGVSIRPELYMALGISGAVQHVTGIGHPDHIIAVNTDPSAPMMAMADLAVVTDAPALLTELEHRLAAEAPARGRPPRSGEAGDRAPAGNP